MATTSNTYTGNGSNKLFSITFPYIETTDIDVYLNGTLQTVTTQYTFANATTIEFVAAPANGAVVLLDRSTDDSTLAATFFPGSSIKAADLNADFDQTLYVVQEINNKAVKKDDPLYANKTYIDAADALKVNKSGDTMSGALAMATNKITGLGNPTNAQDAATKTYVDAADALKVNKAGDTMSGNLAMGGNKVTGLGAPAANADAVTKSYVDGYINTTYLGPLASDPSTRPGGAALQAGDQYFNTTQNIVKVWTGTVWVISAAAGNIVRWRKTASAGNTTLSGVDDLGVTLSYVVGNEQVYLNGALQTRGVDYTAGTGTSITLTPALLAGDVVELHAVQGYVSATITPGSINDAAVAPAAGIQATKLAFTQTGTGATVRTVDSKLKDVVSVKDFGAVGDGVANDTVAIQAALNSGKAVFLPSGTYKVTSQLTMGAPYVFYGEGSLSSVLLTSCAGWTLKAGGAPGNFILKGIHFLGANSNQGTATAKGFQNTTGGAQHEWLIEGCRFTYLLQAIDTPQSSYTGAIRECYVMQCGNGTANYAVEITGDSNNLLVDHLGIQSSQTGWVCRGLLVGAPSPSISIDPLGVTFNHLYIENCHADYAATFRTSCRINGGYFESYETTTNQINFDPVANREVLTISGALIGADIVGRTDLVKLDGCSMLRNNTVQQINSRYPEFRWVQKLANGVLPIQIRQTEIIPLSVSTTSVIKPKVFNLNGWSSSQNVVGDLPFSGYYQGDNANTATVVTNSDLNLGGSNVLRYSINTNGAGVAFGGAMIVDFQVPTQYQYASSYIYAYALVRKVRSDVNYQVALTTADVDNASSYATFSGTTNNDWHLLISAAPANTGMSAGGFQVGIRAFGAAGGNPPTGSTIDIHSIGAAIGGPPTFLAAEVNPLLIAKAEWRKQYEDAWINNVLNQLVSTSGCNSGGASMTFRSITIGATARTLLTTTAGTAITTPGTGTFPIASVNCGDQITVSASTTVPSFATRIYGTANMTASLNSIP